MRASAFKFSQKILGEAGVRLTAAIFIMLLARKLGAAEFGKYSSAMALAALCIVFVDMGTNSLITRELSRRPADRPHIIKASHTVKILSGIGSWGILAGLCYALGFSADTRRLTLLTAILVIGQALTDYFSAVLNGLEEMGWEATLKVIARVSSTGIGLILLFQGKPLMTLLGGMALGTLLGYGVSCLIVRYRVKTFGFSFDWPFIRQLLKTALPLFVSVIFWILYESQDILILNYFRLPKPEIGFFSAAVKILDVLRVYPVLLVGVFFPALSRLYESDSREYARKRARVLTFLSVSLLALGACVYMASPFIIETLYKQAYAPAIPLLRVLACSLVLSGINYSYMQMLITTHQEKRFLVCALLSCGVNVAIAVALVPSCGAMGTCFALLGSEAVNFMYLFTTSRA